MAAMVVNRARKLTNGRIRIRQTVEMQGNSFKS
jgi:hypothetical protein